MRFPTGQSTLRPILFLGAVGAIFLLLFLRLVSLQIVNGVEFRDRSDNNRIRLIEVAAPRGIIRDIHGNIIVTNTASYSCYGVPNELWRDEQSTALLSSVLQFPNNELRSEILRPIRRSFKPVRLNRDLSFSTLSAFEEERDRFPGAFLEIEPKRFHPKKICPHVIGYVGEISEAELEQFPERKEGDLIGKRGLERLYDDQLRGKRGKRFSIVNVHGQEIQASEQYKEIAPIPGNDIWLTIDLGAQMLAESLLTDKIGAAVVIDIATGGVRVSASSPGYDPDIFSGALDPNDWMMLLTDERKPMLNRSVQTMYPPGSVIKMALLIEGLMSGEIDRQWTAHCPGIFYVGNHPFRCWRRGGHGTVNCTQAIEQSCDVFFYKLGMKIGVDGIYRALDRFHFGRKTGVDLSSEAAGLIPSSEYYDRRYGKNGWTVGYIPSIAIGQGEVLVTPMQLCAYAAALGDGKYWRQPYIVEMIRNPTTGIVLKPEHAEPIELKVTEEIINLVQEGMRLVVWGDRGTARAQRREETPIAGKTGTAQNAHGDDHAWFIGYAPVSAPRFAACALVEFGEHGSSVAAPLVRQMLEYMIHTEQPDELTVAQEEGAR